MSVLSKTNLCTILFGLRGVLLKEDGRQSREADDRSVLVADTSPQSNVPSVA